MPKTPGANRIRKACDLCYRRRIKCDGNEPRCSQCVIYDSECTHEAASRRKKPVNSRGPGTQPCSGQSGQNAGPSRQPTRDLHAKTVDLQELEASSMDLSSSQGSKPTPAPTVTNAESTIKTHKLMHLPAEGVVRTLVDAYLTTFNNVLPLYDPPVLSELVDKWYDNQTNRDLLSWASINIVMALAQYQSVHGDVNSAGYTIDVCIINAQSVLTDIMMGDPGLGNVQVILGLVILFQGAPDIRPALILMSTALRLAQILGIHRTDYYAGVHSSEALQRKRVFWIAYILDRDTSLRSRQAPVQQDTDVDLDFPSQPSNFSLGDGVAAPADDQPFDVFYAHVELAQIQSLVYNCIFSAQARHMTPSDTANATRDIFLLIQRWKSRIPAAFSAETLSGDRSTTYPRFFCALYSRVIMCLGQLSHVNSMDLDWIESLLSHARLTGHGFHSVPPPRPQGWDLLINECRSFILLFMSIHRKDPAFLWTNLCPYASSLLCLSADSLLTVGNDTEGQNKKIQDEAASLLNEVAKQMDHELLRRSAEVYKELDWHHVFMTNSLEVLL